MSVNRIILLGNVGQEPELKVLKDTSVTAFSIATTEAYNGTKTTTWHRCKAFGKTGETIAKYIKKGDQVYVEGKMKFGSYENKEGNTVYTAEAIIYSFSFVGNKPKDESQAEERRESTEGEAPF